MRVNSSFLSPSSFTLLIPFIRSICSTVRGQERPVCLSLSLSLSFYFSFSKFLFFKSRENLRHPGDKEKLLRVGQKNVKRKSARELRQKVKRNLNTQSTVCFHMSLFRSLVFFAFLSTATDTQDTSLCPSWRVSSIVLPPYSLPLRHTCRGTLSIHFITIFLSS